VIAALYVESGGVYFDPPGVDPWDEARDARLYAGPFPVVAHPPCARWGRYWSGGPSAKVRRKLGDDGGCFAAALAAVRAFGGVLEHPEATKAFAAFDLPRPPREGGWLEFAPGEFVAQVEQGRYGHPARKKTWLYLRTPPGVRPPELRWGRAEGRRRLDEGFHSAEERRAARAAGRKPRRRLSTRENLRTPPAFRDLLLALAELSTPGCVGLRGTRPVYRLPRR